MKKKLPTLGQGEVRLATEIFITVIGFAELKDHRTGKGFKADPGAVSTWHQCGYSWITFIPYLDRCAVWSRFSKVMVGKTQDRTPNSRGKAETKRQDRIEMVQTMTKKRGSSSERTQTDLSCGSEKPFSLKSRVDATTVLEETMCQLETVIMSLNTSSTNSGPSENAHPALKAPVPVLAQHAAPG